MLGFAVVLDIEDDGGPSIPAGGAAAAAQAVETASAGGRAFT